MVSTGSGKSFVRRVSRYTLPPLFLSERKYDKTIGFMYATRFEDASLRQRDTDEESVG